MDYLPITFEVLVEEVEHQGGALQPDPHISEEITYREPQVQVPDSFTCGCNNATVLVSKYDPEVPKRTVGFVSACAVCDNIGAWPRYENAVKAVSTEYWDNLEWEDDDAEPTE